MPEAECLKGSEHHVYRSFRRAKLKKKHFLSCFRWKYKCRQTEMLVVHAFPATSWMLVWLRALKLPFTYWFTVPLTQSMSQLSDGRKNPYVTRSPLNLHLPLAINIDPTFWNRYRNMALPQPVGLIKHFIDKYIGAAAWDSTESRAVRRTRAFSLFSNVTIFAGTSATHADVCVGVCIHLWFCTARPWQIAEKIVPSPSAVCIGCPWVEWHFKRTISEREVRKKKKRLQRRRATDEHRGLGLRRERERETQGGKWDEEKGGRGWGWNKREGCGLIPISRQWLEESETGWFSFNSSFGYSFSESVQDVKCCRASVLYQHNERGNGSQGQKDSERMWCDEIWPRDVKYKVPVNIFKVKIDFFFWSVNTCCV